MGVVDWQREGWLREDEESAQAEAQELIAEAGRECQRLREEWDRVDRLRAEIANPNEGSPPRRTC